MFLWIIYYFVLIASVFLVPYDSQNISYSINVGMGHISGLLILWFIINRIDQSRKKRDFASAEKAMFHVETVKEEKNSSKA